MKKVKSKLITLEKESVQKIDYTAGIDGAQAPPYDLDVLSDMYNYNGYHAKCIDLKSVITAGLGYEIVSTDGDKDKKPDNEHGIIKGFIESQEERTNISFIETLINFQTDYEIFGNAFFEVVRNNVGEVSEIFHLPGRETRVAFKNGKIFIVQVVNEHRISFVPFGKKEKGNNSNEFLMLKNYNPANRFYGKPEYLGALGALAMDRNAVEFNINKFKNMNIPETIIIFRGSSPDKETSKNIKTMFTANFKGTSNVGRALVLACPDTEGGVDVKPVTSEVKDASFKALRIDARDEIIATHGVPKRILGIAEAGGLGGTGEGESQMKVFKDCVIAPRQRRLENVLNNLISTGLGVKNWKIKLNELYIEDPAADATYYDTMVKNGILLPEEAREELGYPMLDQKTIESKANNQAVTLTKSLLNLRNQIDA